MRANDSGFRPSTLPAGVWRLSLLPLAFLPFIPRRKLFRPGRTSLLAAVCSDSSESGTVSSRAEQTTWNFRVSIGGFSKPSSGSGFHVEPWLAANVGLRVAATS